ncbi:hypothetical protein [Stutzerimonas stutzeri]|uniref:hypothetical protein n=1 Tax=Stutzerimonas stutzeri TaxID=316 RepID=UPI00101AD249|nr:hypothetical protein [Stutzerimonas stutzeri]
MRRNVPEFTCEQIDRLISINRRLAQLEYWCLMRSKRLVEDFNTAAGAPTSWVATEDFELESYVYYYRSLPPESDGDELILKANFLPMPPFKWYYLNPTYQDAADVFEMLHYNWCDGVEKIPRLNEERICMSFHDLHDHHHLDWLQVLEVSRVWVDVHAIHQIETTFTS